MDELCVDVSISGPLAIVRVGGEVDAATAPELDETLRKVEAETALSEIALDFRDVTFIDSSGLSVLVAAHKRLRASGVTLAVTNPSPSTRRLFSIAGVDVVLTVR
jgi:anti-sigma B factor antagonist